MENKVILIDSGRVLNSPRTGNWFITLNFFEYIDEKTFKSLSEDKLNKAFSSAGDYITKRKLIVTEEEEYKHFLEYYRIFFKCLPELKLNDYAIQEITKDLVYNYDKYCFYDEVYDLLPKLSKNHRLALVSDAWPSLENVYLKAGFKNYFSSFIISSLLGVTKPDKLMYETALKELNVSFKEAIFVDDNIKNCDGAKELGIQSFLLCRDIEQYIYYKHTCKNHTVVSSLSEFIKENRVSVSKVFSKGT